VRDGHNNKNEDWPDGAWKNSRYHRASLARVLAHAGMTQQVADAYAALLEQPSPGPPAWFGRIAAEFRR